MRRFGVDWGYECLKTVGGQHFSAEALDLMAGRCRTAHRSGALRRSAATLSTSGVDRRRRQRDEAAVCRASYVVSNAVRHPDATALWRPSEPTKAGRAGHRTKGGEPDDVTWLRADTPAAPRRGCRRATARAGGAERTATRDWRLWAAKSNQITFDPDADQHISRPIVNIRIGAAQSQAPVTGSRLIGNGYITPELSCRRNRNLSVQIAQ